MESLIALVLATLVLVSIPGPNMALIVANSLRYGVRTGVVTAVGTTAGVAIQLVLVVAGLATLIDVAAGVLNWIRWAGAAYLIWLGVQTWRTPVMHLDGARAMRPVFLRACLLAAINPKTLLFSAAFIPQFVAGGSLYQLALVAAVYLLVLLIGDIAWALFANTARVVLRRYSSWRNRMTGTCLVAAGIGLAISRR